jgi:hypothetical protein
MYATFQELNFEGIFDGVWAQASLLHIPYEITREIYEKIHRALTPMGSFMHPTRMATASWKHLREIFILCMKTR